MSKKFFLFLSLQDTIWLIKLENVLYTSNTKCK